MTPDKYKGEKRKYENKEWLQQQYWSEMKSKKEIAALCKVGSTKEIGKAMREFGIPRRPPEAHQEVVSNFRGFYRAHENPPHKGKKTNYDPDYADDTPWADYSVEKAVSGGSE
jgi:hypothetical protein